MPNPMLSDDAGALLTRLQELPESERDLLLSSLAEITTRHHAEGVESHCLPPGADRTGELIGAFRLLRLLGRGGMGQVWLAERQAADFEQHVAIKLIQQGATPFPRLLHRFVTERRILSSLQHPNIARLVDGGRTSYSEPYLAMEYVAGLPLDLYVRTHTPSLRARVLLMKKVCEAVSYAQDRFIVHCDLKPANVLVDHAGEPHVLDFGIAKLLSQDIADQTQFGERAFTPAYAAPEQFAGDPVSAATDVYALGVMLFLVLTGRLPKVQRQTGTTSASEGVRPSREISQHTAADVAASYGDSLSPAALSRLLAGDLDWIVSTATQSDATQRYRNAGELADELGRWLSGAPLKTRSASRWYRAGKLLRQHWLVAAALSVALVSMVAGSVLALAQARRASSEAARAEAEALQASQTRNFIVSTLESATPLTASKGKNVTVTDAVLAALPKLDQDLNAAPKARAELRAVFASVLMGLGETVPALRQLEIAEVEIAAEYGEVSSVMADMLTNRAVLQGMDGNEEAQRADAQRAMSILNQLTDVLTPQDLQARMLRVQTTLVKVESRQGKYDEALLRYQDILDRRTQLFGPTDARLAVDYNNLGVMLVMLERYAAAEQAGRTALSLLRADAATPRARHAWALNTIATAQYNAGDCRAAMASAEESLAIASETLGPTSEPVAIARHTKAMCLNLKGQVKEAEAEWRSIADSNARDGGGVLGQVQFALARLFAEQGRYSEGLVAAKRSLELLGRFRASTDPLLLRNQALVAWMLAANGDVEAARVMLEAVLSEVRASTLALDDWGDVFAFAAGLAEASADPIAAAEYRSEAQHRWREALDPENPRLAFLLATQTKR